MTLRNRIRAVVIVAASWAVAEATPWVAGVPLVAQDSATRAGQVLDQARQALGGDALTNVRVLRAQGDYRRAMGDRLVAGKLELLLDRAGRLRRDEELGRAPGPVAVRVEVLDGDAIWDDMTMRGAMNHGMPGPGAAAPLRPSDDQLRRSRRDELARHQLAWLLDTTGVVSHVGVAEAPDGRADVLEIAANDRTPLRLFVDQRTHLPLMLTWGSEGVSQVERPAAVSLYLSDYRRVHGVMLPHTMRRAIDARALDEWTITAYEVNPSVSAARFRK